MLKIRNLKIGSHPFPNKSIAVLPLGKTELLLGLAYDEDNRRSSSLMLFAKKGETVIPIADMCPKPTGGWPKNQIDQSNPKFNLWWMDDAHVTKTKFDIERMLERLGFNPRTIDRAFPTS